MISRRRFLQHGGILGSMGLAGTGLLGSWAPDSHAAGGDYKALVVLFLNGGNDGHNALVPYDAGYSDYQAARGNLALARASLTALAGVSAGHSFAIHPGLAPLAPLYARGRLAWVANVGPLLRPATAAQVLTNAVEVPPFLGSHLDQVAIQQGWLVKDDMSGWAGRSLELLPSTMQNPLAAVTMNTQRTLVQGRRSRVSFMARDGARYWGPGDLTQPQSMGTQAINRMAQWQFANAYQTEYARTFGAASADSTLFSNALLTAPKPSADFGSGGLADNLRALATVMPVLKALGYRRQVFLVGWGGFDTHANQLGSGADSQDSQLGVVGKALAGFDQALQSAALGDDVVTLTMSDFGRTLRPGSGGGSEHGWGSHWIAMGGPVAGGKVIGTFPTLTLGGPDDGDPNRNGRMVPSTATDQVGATLMQWMGLPTNLIPEAFPNLVNFSQKTLPLLHA